jgi:hypothetical protein
MTQVVVKAAMNGNMYCFLVRIIIKADLLLGEKGIGADTPVLRRGAASKDERDVLLQSVDTYSIDQFRVTVLVVDHDNLNRIQQYSRLSRRGIQLDFEGILWINEIVKGG